MPRPLARCPAILIYVRFISSFNTHMRNVECVRIWEFGISFAPLPSTLHPAPFPPPSPLPIYPALTDPHLGVRPLAVCMGGSNFESSVSGLAQDMRHVTISDFRLCQLCLAEKGRGGSRE